MPMRMKVYKVDRDGGIRVVHEESEVVPLKRPEERHAYPACECDLCKKPS
ncbi:hypothetical protein [Streptomyces atroolivaceus]